MTKSEQHLIDTLDIIFLGTIGIGTIAWFARHQISEKLFGSKKQPEIKPAEPNASASPKKERNFVKVMQDQVRNNVCVNKKKRLCSTRICRSRVVE